MKAILVLLVILKFKSSIEQEEDEVLDVIKSSGYDGEFNEVETEDGYILGLHRIHSKNHNSTKYPVFLMHGFLTTPISFFITSTKNSLPFMLADRYSNYL